MLVYSRLGSIGLGVVLGVIFNISHQGDVDTFTAVLFALISLASNLSVQLMWEIVRYTMAKKKGLDEGVKIPGIRLDFQYAKYATYATLLVTGIHPLLTETLRNSLVSQGISIWIFPLALILVAEIARKRRLDLQDLGFQVFRGESSLKIATEKLKEFYENPDTLNIWWIPTNYGPVMRTLRWSFFWILNMELILKSRDFLNSVAGDQGSFFDLVAGLLNRSGNDIVLIMTMFFPIAFAFRAITEAWYGLKDLGYIVESERFKTGEKTAYSVISNQ